MSGLQVEIGIPLPDRGYERTGLAKTMKEMDVGDSFVYDLTKRSSITGTATLIKQSGNRDFKVTTRKINDAEIRVWRLA